MKKVLIIDDTKNIRLLLQKCLEVEGYAVQAADNGKAGLELLLAERFDLCFLDIKLPELSGTEVLRRIRSEGVETPVIIITAYPTIKNAVDTTQLGAIAYLQKPFTADRLRSVLSSLELSGDKKSSPADQAEEALASGDFDRAVKLLKTALADTPQNPELYKLLGRAYEGLGDLETAQKFTLAGQIFE